MKIHMSGKQLSLNRVIFRRFRRSREISKSNLFRSEGDLFRDAGDFEKAANAYNSHLRMHADDFDIWVQNGNCLKDCGRFDEARQAYDRARELNPTDPDLHVQLGHLANKMNDLVSAELFYTKARELSGGTLIFSAFNQASITDHSAPGAVEIKNRAISALIELPLPTKSPEDIVSETHVMQLKARLCKDTFAQVKRNA